MVRRYDLSSLTWKLAGFIPYDWHFKNYPALDAVFPDVPIVPARVPGSVQCALREAGVIPDWNEGLAARACEWVENRHWVFETHLPAEWLADGDALRLVCSGLDYSGWVALDGKVIGEFTGSLVPHVFTLTPHVASTVPVATRRLQIAFDCPPRWLGQLGYTSRMKEWKPRFNYTWDWVSRIVQTGIWDDIYLEASDGPTLDEVRCFTDYDTRGHIGSLTIHANVSSDAGGLVRLTLKQDDAILKRKNVPLSEVCKGYLWKDLPVRPWCPNGHGDQPLYTVIVNLIASDGSMLDSETRRVGFKRVAWRPCEGAPDGADPWVCVVNDVPIFLQGVNWSPIRPNFADVTEADYRKRLERYRDMGCTILRVWGGAFLEKEWFYDLCDEMGLLVWQEFPLSSSGLDNWPPEDDQTAEDLAEIAESYILRRQHHVSLLLWCGGNELLGGPDGSIVGAERSVDASHPVIGRLRAVVAERDPTRRFLPTSPSGPICVVKDENIGKGLHWDMHGPWKPEGALSEGWKRLWVRDDAFMHSEVGAPGASSADMIRRYRGDLPDFPASGENPLWGRTSWWIEWDACVKELGREPLSLEEYVGWSQERQRQALAIAARTSRERFPRCGGFIVWHGHDCFPCTANTAILDFDGNPKPAAEALAAVFKQPLPAQR